MCRKILLSTCFVLILGFVGYAEDIQWTDSGTDHLWSTPENWDLGRVPTLADEVRIDVPAAAEPNGPVIQDGVVAEAHGIFTEAPGQPTLTMTGGSLEVVDWIWWGDGTDSYAVWTMSGGTVTVANEFELGWGGGAGTLIMTGGTINAGEAVIPTGSGAFGELRLHGGTYNITKPGGLEVNENGLVDITEGTLVIEGDETEKINDLIARGLMTAHGGAGQLELDFDVGNPGKTTVTALSGPPHIIWVSDFYDDNGDEIPDDQPWVRLLEAHGYTVDYTMGPSPGDGYWRTLDDEKIAALNAADLIIVSRNSNSGDYADENEPTQWNSITTPLILQATHIVRSNRWRWLDTTSTNNAIPRLQAIDRCNPVFQHVTLDVNDQVDVYARANSTFAGTVDAGNGAVIAARADTGDVAIVEWQAGVEFYPGSEQMAGGPRMYFPAGTQDVAAEMIGRGEYNLTLEGKKMFLNAVAIFAPLDVTLSDVTSPGDPVIGVPDDGDWPGNESPPLAIDDNVETKYLHFKGDFEPDPGTGGTGFRVTPSTGRSIVTGLTLTTANDVPGRDPIAYQLSGSNTSVNGPYEFIARGNIDDFAQAQAWPRFTTNETPIAFHNDVAYDHYQLIFTAIRGPVGGSVNSMQIADVELIGHTPKSCTEKTGAEPATDPNILVQFPVLAAIDSQADLNLLNPLHAYFQDDVRDMFGLEDFDNLYHDYDLAIVPEAFDVRDVNIINTGDGWRFIVNTFGAGAGDSGFQPLVSSGQGRVTIYVDTNIDFISDVLLTNVTTNDGTLRMVAVTSDYEPLPCGTTLVAQWNESIRELIIDVPEALIGQHFDWILATGFAVSQEASCGAVLDPSIRWTPTVDIVMPECPTCDVGVERSVNFFDSFQSFSQCQVWNSVASTCPASGQPSTPLPGPITPSGSQGWLVMSVECPQRKMRLYCSADFIGWVDNGIEAGWYAHCPYGGGQNNTTAMHVDSDNIPEGWVHSVKTPSGSHKTEYIYMFGPPYTYVIKMYSGSTPNQCQNLQLTDYPWGLPWSHCSYP